MGVLPLTAFFLTIWKFFISNNYFYYRIKPVSFDVLAKTNFFKKLKYSVFLKWNLISLTFLITCVVFFKNESLSFFWNHLILSNFKFWFFFCILVLNILSFVFYKLISNNNLSQSIDFFFALANLSSFTPLVFCCNTFFTFLFVMEVVSVLLFYKFVVSKVWFKSTNTSLETGVSKWTKLMPKQYLNVLFFQFWSNFFSTVLIFVTILSFFVLFGTSEWSLLKILFLINAELGCSYSTNNYIFLMIPLLLGVFFKLGVTPLHLYKIEVYKGVPFITIFFYTTYFFFIFVSFFSYLLMVLLEFFSFYWVFFLATLFVLGALLLVCLLFDVQFVKAFFAYSTVINVLLILLVVIIYFNV